MSHVYDNPRYYEIAFSFRDFTHEVDVFEECIRRYAGVRVESFLERGCGNAPHMPELVKRGYRYIGLDINDAMLAYARSKASDTGNATFLKADMCNFRVEQTAQFAFVSLGSLFAPSTTDLVQHFRSVGDAIQSGGLYLLDWCVQFSPLVNRKETWVLKRTIYA
jgi:SAM-dependent methyltransferase